MAGQPVPTVAQAAVLAESDEMPEGSVPCVGHDFNRGRDFDAILKSMMTTGFQATNFALAVEEVRRMRAWRLSDEPVSPDERDEYLDPTVRAQTRCTVFLGCTSNLVSAGTRECIRYMIQHKKVDCMVTTAGGIEEDVLKCLAPHYMGDFALQGAALREKGINRIGNLLVPNKNYCLFEDWLTPLLDEMLQDQQATGEFYGPQSMIWKMGEKLDRDENLKNKEESILLWAYRNKIPIFCPAITDGSIGDMIYFRSFTHPGLVIDIAQDIKKINNLAVKAARTGVSAISGHSRVLCTLHKNVCDLLGDGRTS